MPTQTLIRTPYDLAKVEQNLLLKVAPETKDQNARKVAPEEKGKVEVVYIRKKLNEQAKDLVKKLRKQIGRTPDSVLADQLELLDEIEIYVRRPKTFFGDLSDLFRRGYLISEALQHIQKEEVPVPEEKKKKKKAVSKVKRILKKVLKYGSVTLAGAVIALLGSLLVPKWRESILRKLFGLTSKALIAILKKMQKPQEVLVFFLRKLATWVKPIGGTA